MDDEEQYRHNIAQEEQKRELERCNMQEARRRKALALLSQGVQRRAPSPVACDSEVDDDDGWGGGAFSVSIVPPKPGPGNQEKRPRHSSSDGHADFLPQRSKLAAPVEVNLSDSEDDQAELKNLDSEKARIFNEHPHILDARRNLNSFAASYGNFTAQPIFLPTTPPSSPDRRSVFRSPSSPVSSTSATLPQVASNTKTVANRTIIMIKVKGNKFEKKARCYADESFAGLFSYLSNTFPHQPFELTFDGTAVTATQTPSELGMEDGEQMDLIFR